MDIKMKHRIVGIVVLIALAVIFIPLLFGRGEKGPKLASHIPNPPAKPSIELTIPAVSQATVPASSNEPLAVEPLQPATLANANNPASVADNSEESTTRIATPVAATPAVTTAAATAPATIAPAAIAPVTNNQPATAAPVSATSANPPAATQNNAQQQPNQEELPRTKAGLIKAEFAALKLKKPGAKTNGVKPAELAQAWAVQLGSFSQKTNANQLVKRLRAKGYAAYIQKS